MVYGCTILLHGRLHKRPGLHIAFMMQRRPALAGNNGSTSTSPPLATFPCHPGPIPGPVLARNPFRAPAALILFFLW